MDLYVCPKINDLDPAADGFDGGGHTVSTHPGQCQSNLESERTCHEELLTASAAWRAFYGLPAAPESEPAAEEA